MPIGRTRSDRDRCYSLAVASLPEIEPRPISVAEYHRMIDAGILDEDERVELLEGVIATMSPQNDPHSFALEELNSILVPQVQGRFRVRIQSPVTLGDRSEPEPDAVIVPPRSVRGRGHPTSALLVIEISDTSLRRDRGVKSRIYARGGVPEYWIVNLKERCIEVYRDPDAAAGTYLASLHVPAGQEARPILVPGVVVPVAALFD